MAITLKRVLTGTTSFTPPRISGVGKPAMAQGPVNGAGARYGFGKQYGTPDSDLDRNPNAPLTYYNPANGDNEW